MTAEQAKFLLNFFLPSVEQEAQTTKKVLAAIPEDRREYRPDPKGRTAMELAWHIASSELWFLDGIANGEFGQEEEQPPSGLHTVADVIAWYDKTLPPAIEKLRALPGEKLTTSVSFFGLFNYPAVAYLSFLVVHSVHHRGQLSVYLRPMGSKVPSIYGGSADEPFQMPAQA